MNFLHAGRLLLSGAILTMLSVASQATQNDAVRFMQVKGKTSQPVGHYEFCAGYPEECSITSSKDARVKLTPRRWNMLVSVNTEVNTKIVPATDQEMFGRPEIWVYPTKRGDCEDLVLLKRKMLIEKGWPVGALLITVARQRNGEGHAVLTVLTDRGDLILDNLNPHVFLWNETPYHFVKRQSEFDSGAWVSIDDGRAPMVGSLKN